MKPFFLVILTAFTFFQVCSAQTQYEVKVEQPGEKTYKGVISQEILKADTSFKWYAENLKGYTPNAKAVDGLRKNADSIQLLVFMGTWCEDSHAVIPKFYSLIETAGFSKDKITLVGVDRSKKTIGHLAEALQIKNVPTIIVMKNGKEAGRVVEYGKYGLYDMELAGILGAL